MSYKPMSGFMKFYTMCQVANNNKHKNKGCYDPSVISAPTPISYTPVEDIPTAYWNPIVYPYKGFECSHCGNKLFEWEEKSEYCPLCHYHMTEKFYLDD